MVVLVLGLLVPSRPAVALSAFDQSLISLVNDWRASNGLSRLQEHAPMSARARGWSDHLAGGSANCTSGGSRWGHSSLSLSDPANPPGTTALSENVAYACGVPGMTFGVTWSTAAGPLPAYCTSSMDYTTPEMTVCGWLSSPGHRAAIANPNFTHIGSGTATVTTPSGGTERFSTHQFAAASTAAPAPDGDVTCDGSVDIIDAMAIAQYDVGGRTDAGSCSMADPAGQLFAARGDLDRDGSTDIIDALLIAQCVVGIPNAGCP